MITVMFPQRFYVFTVSFHLRILEISSCECHCISVLPQLLPKRSTGLLFHSFQKLFMAESSEMAALTGAKGA